MLEPLTPSRTRQVLFGAAAALFPVIVALFAAGNGLPHTWKDRLAVVCVIAQGLFVGAGLRDIRSLPTEEFPAGRSRMMTRRDLLVALTAVAVTLAGVAAVGAQSSVLSSTIFDWTSMTAQANKTGSVRRVVQSPTATLDELEIHITTLNPGERRTRHTSTRLRSSW